MTINEEITVECFLERVENFIQEYNNLRNHHNENYTAYESRVIDLISELSRDIKDNNKGV